jgi:hypothetical protein
MSFSTEIAQDGAVLTGPPRHPAQMLAGQKNAGAASVHDDEVAAKLGLAGAPIEGPTHFSQLDPLAVELWGSRWFETGCISSHFRTMVVKGESVIASLTDLGSGRAEIAAVKGDETPVLSGTASVDPAAPTALQLRLAEMQQKDPGELHIIDRLSVGDELVHESQSIGMNTTNGDGYPFSLRQKLDQITEPSSWYKTDDNPWRRAIVPFEMYSVLTNKSLGMPGIRRPANGLFIDLEVRAVDGPLFVGQAYTVEKELVCLGQSRRVESYWTESRVFDVDTGNHAATVLLHQGIFKASFPDYPGL